MIKSQLKVKQKWEITNNCDEVGQIEAYESFQYPWFSALTTRSIESMSKSDMDLPMGASNYIKICNSSLLYLFLILIGVLHAFP